jgi:hypothetical protein
MSSQLGVSILAQASEEDPISGGLIGNGPQWVTIDKKFTLFAVAEDKSDESGKLARLALEILLDDIQTNLSSGEYDQATDYEKHVLATRCVEESFENINDYLISQSSSGVSGSRKGVALTVMQVIHGQCSFINADVHPCLHFQEGKLYKLNHHISADRFDKGVLGISESLAIKSNQLVVSANDLLLTCSQELLKHVDEEFLRVTLTRFQDSPQMAMRQITSKAQRSGMQGKPLLIIMAINQLVAKPRSWFKR